MKRLVPLLLAASLIAAAGDPPKDPKKGPPGKEKLFTGNVGAGTVAAPGAEIASGWSWTLDADAVAAKDPIVADAKGHFEKSMPWKDKKTFLAMDAGHKMGAAMEIKEGELAKPVTFRLVPMVRVKMKVKSRDAGFPTDGIKVEVKLDGAERIGGGTTTADGLAILVPPGKYKLRFDKEGWQPRSFEVVVPAGKPEFVGPDAELVPSILASHVGQALPEWHIADAIGIPKDTKLASFRGKWVILLFWRDGCPSCRGWGIPNLVKFHDKHAAWKDRLQIVAFHNKDAKTAGELTDFLAKSEGIAWSPLQLPFPIVIDSPDPSTVDEWGPGEFPYGVLLDAEGKLVAKGALEDLEKRLAQEFK
ncbi:MAG: redoxin family protein [Planctomycetes bacterium]|nr:redoxin family protein [Planctomycetota bacterium]